MPENPHGHVTGLTAFTDADAALARITEIYAAGTAAIRARFAEFPGGGGEPAAAPACYPYVGIVIGPDQVNLSGALAYGKLQGPGAYGTTLTRPDLFRGYYREQLDLLLRNHGQPVWVGTTDPAHLRHRGGDRRHHDRPRPGPAQPVSPA
jgi:AMP nucleosidase